MVPNPTPKTYAWLTGATALLLMMASVAGSGAAERAIGIDPLDPGASSPAQLAALQSILADLQHTCALDPSACQTGADFFGLDDLLILIIIVIIVMACDEDPEDCELSWGGSIAGGSGPVGGFGQPLPGQQVSLPVGRAIAPDVLCAYWFGPPCDDLDATTQLGAGSSQACARPSEVLTVTTAGRGIYLEDRSKAPGEVNHWVYVESNGVPGLQRGGENLLGESDPCRDPGVPDALIF